MKMRKFLINWVLCLIPFQSFAVDSNDVLPVIQSKNQAILEINLANFQNGSTDFIPLIDFSQLAEAESPFFNGALINGAGEIIGLTHPINRSLIVDPNNADLVIGVSLNIVSAISVYQSSGEILGTIENGVISGVDGQLDRFNRFVYNSDGRIIGIAVGNEVVATNGKYLGDLSFLITDGVNNLGYLANLAFNDADELIGVLTSSGVVLNAAGEIVGTTNFNAQNARQESLIFDSVTLTLIGKHRSVWVLPDGNRQILDVEGLNSISNSLDSRAFDSQGNFLGIFFARDSSVFNNNSVTRVFFNNVWQRPVESQGEYIARKLTENEDPTKIQFIDSIGRSWRLTKGQTLVQTTYSTRIIIENIVAAFPDFFAESTFEQSTIPEDLTGHNIIRLYSAQNIPNIAATGLLQLDGAVFYSINSGFTWIRYGTLQDANHDPAICGSTTCF